jgi:uncharacterized protein (DUF2147 family)
MVVHQGALSEVMPRGRCVSGQGNSMHKLATILVTISALSGAVANAGAPTVLGAWHYLGGRTIVTIAPCPGSPSQLCGALTALAKPLDANGHAVVDSKNPNPALRNRPILGLNLLSGFKPVGGGVWAGKIYDPGSGNTFDSKFNLAANADLTVKGCIGILCVTQDWTRTLTKP